MLPDFIVFAYTCEWTYVCMCVRACACLSHGCFETAAEHEMFVHDLFAICDGDDMIKKSIHFTFDFQQAVKWPPPSTAPVWNSCIMVRFIIFQWRINYGYRWRAGLWVVAAPPCARGSSPEEGSSACIHSSLGWQASSRRKGFLWIECHFLFFNKEISV